MRKLIGVTLAVLLSLTSVAPALAQEAVSEDVLGEQIRRDYQETPTEVKIDMMTALVARGEMNTEMGRLSSDPNEAVLGESVTREDVGAEAMIQMLEQLKARGKMDDAMRNPSAS